MFKWSIPTTFFHASDKTDKIGRSINFFLDRSNCLYIFFQPHAHILLANIIIIDRNTFYCCAWSIQNGKKWVAPVVRDLCIVYKAQLDYYLLLVGFYITVCVMSIIFKGKIYKLLQFGGNAKYVRFHVQSEENAFEGQKNSFMHALSLSHSLHVCMHSDMQKFCI